MFPTDVADAAKLIAARAASAVATAINVPSPCTSVCTMDAATGWCNGCLRTVEEIAAWSAMPDATKRSVWAELARRAGPSVV